LLRLEPPNAPTIPATAKTPAHSHFTVFMRACDTRFAAAFTATAKAVVPMAMCTLGTPTT
jgi:hypothetical protein